MIKTICYGTEREWESREKAIGFFSQCMCMSEGSERARYAEIVMQLANGYDVCSDEDEARVRAEQIV